MELNHLRTFREVVRERSFTAAARRLFLTQPAVSQQVKALETEIGERLLERTGRDVRPTPAGTILLEADVAFRRPGTGMAPRDAPLLVGRELRRPLGAGELIDLGDVR